MTPVKQHQTYKKTHVGAYIYLELDKIEN